MQQSKPDWGKRPISAKPTEAPKPDQIDKLVRGGKGGPKRRLNAQIDADLHARVKAKCALANKEIKDIVSELLEAWVK